MAFSPVFIKYSVSPKLKASQQLGDPYLVVQKFGFVDLLTGYRQKVASSCELKNIYIILGAELRLTLMLLTVYCSLRQVDVG